MGPDLTGAYFWPAGNKRPTPLWPEYFLTQLDEIFFDPKGNIAKFKIFRGNFPNPNQRWLTWPEQQKTDPSLVLTDEMDVKNVCTMLDLRGTSQNLDIFMRCIKGLFRQGFGAFWCFIYKPGVKGRYPGLNHWQFNQIERIRSHVSYRLA